jgi:hypothetical protein
MIGEEIKMIADRNRLAEFFRMFLLSAGIAAATVGVVLMGPAVAAAADGPISVGGQKQLFIDHKFIASSKNVSLRVNPPAKRPGAVIESDKPWDAFKVIWLSVAEDGNLYKMWYQAFDGDQWGGGKSRLCYAVSKDLLHWEKPELGIITYQGSKQNNIVVDDLVNGSVLVDPQAKPEQRYKLIYTQHPAWDDVFVVCSSDGTHWTMPGTKVAKIHADTQHVVFWDTRIKKYVVYFRPDDPLRMVDPIPSDPPVVAPKTIRPGRMVARLELDDLVKPWPTSDARMVLTADERDPEDSDIYTHYPLQYPYAADAYFLFPMIYQHFRPGETTVKNDGLNDVQLAASRDGIHWMRYDREPYVRRGLPGDPDSGQVQSCWPTVFRRGNYLYQFYTGWPFTHGGFRKLTPEERKHNWGREHIYLTVQRLDGFVSADAPYDGGWLVTPTIVFDGRALQLNIDVAAMGEARVEIQDADGKPVPGYELAKCKRILFNDPAYTESWEQKSDVAELAGKPIRLRLSMRSAKLYAFQFVP